jgi:hypothetical protein
MTRPVLFVALLILFASAIAGCEEQQQRERVPAFGPAFGNAVQNNMAVQIINPVPPAETVAPDYNGRRAVGALERYRADRVTPPATTTITTLGGGGGASTGGGASAPSSGPPQ